MLVKNVRFYLPNIATSVWLSVGGPPLEFRRDLWHQKSRIPGLSYSVVCVILGLVVLIEPRLVTDRQTVGRTDTL